MSKSVLIVEDDELIAALVEDALSMAGYEVCGVAASEAHALALAKKTQPDFAVVDISLRPGDGRSVAKVLWQRLGVAVLFATGQCEDVRMLDRTGAIGCLPKPYNVDDVPPALEAIDNIRCGRSPGPLPDDMIALHAS